ncbi:multidrug effflux MFS transporter [Alkalilimnicola sp. S0819]|uniref:multidrug effflux MFS transporter n=1 Tax=Alkalilimnicola sp. S0819 TaxID=2613922 RepID=UPI0012627760|nr:multidrug effflux MFS transporter [Alkalilimnicola sp. S0819]KAB7622753.1 multidrug effflux MFS transporter [Alkalilimnicola sp. S0819]MPQ17246.1 Bcr/CflA family efflux MFS transporter [Alkalilimnicola sp. S0819]
MLKLRSTPTTLMLAAAVAIGPLALDLYLPAMPAIGEALGVGADKVQLTLSVYVLGFALAQILVGPLSDRYGRKPVLVGGLLLFTGASVLATFAQSIETLLLARLLQAVGGAAPPVLGRAAVRDIYGPLEAARILAYMGLIFSLAPALAPIIGGQLLIFFDWPSNFAALAVYGGALALLLFTSLPETLAPEHRQSIAPTEILRNYRTLCGNRLYLGYTLINAAGFAAMFAFISGSSFVLIEFLGIPAHHYGYYFMLGVFGFMVGSFIAGRNTRRLGIDRLLLLAGLLTAGGGALMLTFALGGDYSALTVVGPQVIIMIGAGIIAPQAMAGLMGPFPHMAGSASALAGFLQMVIAALAGSAVGFWHDGTPLSMAAVSCVAGCSALLLYLGVVQPVRRAQQRRAANQPPAGQVVKSC